MGEILLGEALLSELYERANRSERHRQAFDLRTTPEDGSQRMINAIQPGTVVPIHRHIHSDETNICLEGRLDVILYEEYPTVVEGGPVHDGEKAVYKSVFKEVARFRLCPLEKQYGIQIPKMTWHTIEVYEPSTIFEAKDGPYHPLEEDEIMKVNG